MKSRSFVVLCASLIFLPISLVGQDALTKAKADANANSPKEVPSVAEVRNSKDEQDQVKNINDRAADWLDARAESGLVLVNVISSDDNPGFTAQEIAGATNTMWILNQEEYRITIGFDKEITAKTSLKELRESFKYIALDKLPTPGLAEEGWEISPRTPSSSFKAGVELLDFREGKITLRVKTRFFALGGRDTTVQVPADAGQPEGSYFQLRQEFGLDLTLAAPVVFK